MARRTVLTIVAISFALTLGLSVYLQFAERETTRRPNRTSVALDTYSDFSWPATPVAPTLAPVPPAAPTPAPSMAPVVRIKAPSIGVDAPIITRGLDRAGIMEDPPDPVSVVWYDFSAQPGYTGNVVLAGHVDYHNYGPAVFWDLRKLTVGDRLQVALQDGSSYTYQVASLAYYDAATAPVGEIVGSTPTETLTLITCGGTFNRRAGDYDKRLVVRAIRVA
jgi:LPXTG-site transpeptidase (sortase) family protein